MAPLQQKGGSRKQGRGQLGLRARYWTQGEQKKNKKTHVSARLMSDTRCDLLRLGNDSTFPSGRKHQVCLYSTLERFLPKKQAPPVFLGGACFSSFPIQKTTQTEKRAAVLFRLWLFAVGFFRVWVVVSGLNRKNRPDFPKNRPQFFR